MTLDHRYEKRGYGALDISKQQDALAMLRDGMTQQAVADRYGVSKNAIAGLWARQGEGVVREEPTTLYTRCAALHARLDAVLAVTVGIGIVPNEPKGKPG
jgi:DNA-binding transcriptional regulator LsrR (DeoR family)